MRPAAQLPPSMSDLAARQRGNLHLDDLHNHGLSTGALRGLEERGVLVPVAPRTWRCGGSPSTWEAEADGVLRWAGPESALSFGSSARLRGIRGVPARARIEVTVPYARHGQLSQELAARTGSGQRPVRLVRSRDFPAVDRTIVDGLRTTTVPRLLVDASSLLRASSSLALLDQVVGEHRVPLAAVHARAVALRPGRGGLGALIAATAPDAPAIFRSWLERYSAQVFAAAGLRGFRYNVEVRDDGQLVAVVDVYWDEARLPVELDGMRVHAPANAAREDRRRTNRLRKLGISPLHYTYLDVLEEPERVLGEITQALRAAGCQHLIGPSLVDPRPLPPLPGTRSR